MVDRDNLTFRLAIQEDAPAIRDLTRAAYSKWVSIIGREPLPMMVDYAWAVRTHRFDLLEQAGSLAALLETVQHPHHLWVESLAVSPTHHGQGLGRRMLQRAEHITRSLGLTEIKLLTNRAFTGNVEFYERAGFVLDHEEPFMGWTTAYLNKVVSERSVKAEPAQS